MPVVVLEMWEGRAEEQKEKLMKGIVKAFEEIGVNSQRVTIIIHETPRSNWGIKGEQALKTNP